MLLIYRSFSIDGDPGLVLPFVVENFDSVNFKVSVPHNDALLEFTVFDVIFDF